MSDNASSISEQENEEVDHLVNLERNTQRFQYPVRRTINCLSISAATIVFIVRSAEIFISAFVVCQLVVDVIDYNSLINLGLAFSIFILGCIGLYANWSSMNEKYTVQIVITVINLIMTIVLYAIYNKLKILTETLMYMQSSLILLAIILHIIMNWNSYVEGYNDTPRSGRNVLVL